MILLRNALVRTAMFLALSSVASGCAESELDQDQEAAAQILEGKGDAYGITRLERATSTQVTTSFKLVRGADLAQCFAGYKTTFDPSATKLTRAITEQFIQVSLRTSRTACSDWFDLSEIVKGVLDMQGVNEATPTDVINALPSWAKPKLDAASVAGFVDIERAPLLFYDDIIRVRDANAMARERDPSGIDLAQLRSQWAKVRSGTTLDRAYLNPVMFRAGALDGADLFKYLRTAFPLRGLSLVATGRDAIDAFAAAEEGPDRDPAFSPIARLLGLSSIKKRFYYARQGDWSSNVLVVVDEHGQAWGLQMGHTS